MPQQFPIGTDKAREQSGRDLATLVYLIQAISLFTAVPFFIGVIVNYAKRGDVRGTLAESHFRWQIRTFWFWLLWTVIGSATWWLLGLGFLILGVAWVWAIYRVVRGWLVLADNRPAY
ncbi:DUF4870 family protein [Microbulbifer rhizosphaerae]|uniref:Putative membrane protein n=1 Tax=Microbulbifer rhizosphaerae TaxID=1562603 RepID=A0A7W4ZAJ6_9GAMM|nr:hypothetical protein [Microbulbifer rhizosphaerae]MBB3062636.1 putative membrane protein [Microbulbifer rhizosphaerae]